MAKPRTPPNLNVGATTAGTGTFRPRPLPAANPDPDVNPAAAALIAGAPVHTVEQTGHEMSKVSTESVSSNDGETVASAHQEMVSAVNRRGAATKVPQATERFVPKFSLGSDIVDVLDATIRRARKKSGDDVTQSRVVAAALLALADLGDTDLVEAIRRVPLVRRGRKPVFHK